MSVGHPASGTRRLESEASGMGWRTGPVPAEEIRAARRQGGRLGGVSPAGGQGPVGFTFLRRGKPGGSRSGQGRSCSRARRGLALFEARAGAGFVEAVQP